MHDASSAPFEVFAGMVFLAAAVAYAWMRLFKAANPAWWRPAAWGILTMMMFELVIAANGVLQQWNRRPPPMLGMLVFVFGGVIYVSRRFGPALARLPFAALIGVQAFRLPLELVMHRAASTGIMPVAMSYAGYNFDILSGITAALVGWLAYRGLATRWMLWGWNLLGSTLLLIIVGISIAATPLPHAFGYDQVNTWIADPPFVWLPGVLVPAAALGHLVIWRKLLTEQ